MLDSVLFLGSFGILLSFMGIVKGIILSKKAGRLKISRFEVDNNIFVDSFVSSLFESVSIGPILTLLIALVSVPQGSKVFNSFAEKFINLVSCKFFFRHMIFVF